MRVFVTGATGNIGSQVVKQLIGAGHEVLGLCRSPDKAAALRAAGAQVHPGSIEDLQSIRDGAAQADGVIHLAFNHDFSRFVQNCEDDRQVIATLASALAGTQRPLIVTSGTAIANAVGGVIAIEDNAPILASEFPRAASEEAAKAAAANGVHVTVMRLPQVHDVYRQGLVSFLIPTFIERGECLYIEEGKNRWPAVALSDAASIYRLALEKNAPWAVYHAVGEEGVTMRDIAQTLGERLDLPVRSIPKAQAESVFGWMAHLASGDLPASSAQTRRVLGWHPSGPPLLDDLAELVWP